MLCLASKSQMFGNNVLRGRSKAKDNDGVFSSFSAAFERYVVMCNTVRVRVGFKEGFKGNLG